MQHRRRWHFRSLMLVIAAGLTACGTEADQDTIPAGSALTSIPAAELPTEASQVIREATAILNEQTASIFGAPPSSVTPTGPGFFHDDEEHPRGWVFIAAWAEPLSGDFEGWPNRSCVSAETFQDLHRVSLTEVTELTIIVDVAFRQIDRIDPAPPTETNASPGSNINLGEATLRRPLEGERPCVAVSD